MAYELLDLETGNAQGVYGSLLEALQAVREAVDRLGPSTVKDLVLYESLPNDEIRPIAQEEELLPLIGSQPTSQAEPKTRR